MILFIIIYTVSVRLAYLFISCWVAGMFYKELGYKDWTALDRRMSMFFAAIWPLGITVLALYQIMHSLPLFVWRNPWKKQ